MRPLAALVTMPPSESFEGDPPMEMEWFYLIGATTVMGAFATVLFVMSIYAPGPKK